MSANVEAGFGRFIEEAYSNEPFVKACRPLVWTGFGDAGTREHLTGARRLGFCEMQGKNYQLNKNF
ncbi:10151_t:CDS:2 [Ambispora gerdemannii]|uniref:10151_t:CDS:1 n=1 Tax=Ambispora gerdemannii TaxID=144530 RepID=A0A9N9BRC0_9GLOM|nr:10151_t:CDS:2 [Ambispora gerdemannii]